LSYTTGIERNDTAFNEFFPYEQMPWSGVNPKCGCEGVQNNNGLSSEKPAITATEQNAITGKEVSAPDFLVSAFPNPFTTSSTIKYRVTVPSDVKISVYDATGKQVAVLVNKRQSPGTYNIEWKAGSNAKGIYFINAIVNGTITQSVRVAKQ
jgi:flagellar hook assembly protein FlgD